MKNLRFQSGEKNLKNDKLQLTIAHHYFCKTKRSNLNGEIKKTITSKSV